MQGRGRVSVLADGRGQSVGAVLGTGKHDRLPHRVFVQQGHQHGLLLRDVAHIVDVLGDLGILCLGGGDADTLRVLQKPSGQGRDTTFEGRREHHRLAGGGGRRHDPFDIREKAHIEHAVGLV